MVQASLRVIVLTSPVGGRVLAVARVIVGLVERVAVDRVRAPDLGELLEGRVDEDDGDEGREALFGEARDVADLRREEGWSIQSRAQHACITRGRETDGGNENALERNCCDHTGNVFCALL